MARSARGTKDFAPFRRSLRSGWLRGTCWKPASFNPVKLFSPSVYTVEPGSTLSLRKPNSVSFLKSGITAMRARPVVVRPFLDGHQHQRRLASLELATAAQAGLGTANPCIINL